MLLIEQAARSSHAVMVLVDLSEPRPVVEVERVPAAVRRHWAWYWVGVVECEPSNLFHGAATAECMNTSPQMRSLRILNMAETRHILLEPHCIGRKP